MPDSEQELLDRYLAGELSKSEQRTLAQTALDNPELFDLLATVAAAKAVGMHDGEADGGHRCCDRQTLGVATRRQSATPRKLLRPLAAAVGFTMFMGLMISLALSRLLTRLWRH